MSDELPPLTTEFARALPDGSMDDSTFEAVETALDRAEAPSTVGDRWLSLPERVACLQAVIEGNARELRELSKALVNEKCKTATLTRDVDNAKDPEWCRRFEEVLAGENLRLSELVAAHSRPWIFPNSIQDMPAKPGKASYEYVECLVLRRGEIMSRPWNCEHLCFDDEDQDDHFCDWDDIEAYQILPEVEAIRAAQAAGASLPHTPTSPK